MSSALQPVEYGHLKQRYKFNRVCKIFNVHEDTFRTWMRDGIQLANGKRIRIRYLPVRPPEFECDEIERVYQEWSNSSLEESADVLLFPDEEDEREERRSRGKKRRLTSDDDDEL